MENPFKIWSTEKKLKDSDLIFTGSLKSPYHQELFQKVADLLATLRPSFSEGVQTLELLTDLILMGHNEELFANAQNFEGWKLHLKKLRYPMTSAHDSDLKTKLENLPWPSQAKIKFERRGDRAGVEVKFFVSSTADLTKLIASLERVQAEISK